jgi:hypothetical protein
MRKVLLLVVSLAAMACAGSQQTAPAPAPAPAAAPTPSADAPLTVAEYDAMADQLCACPDLACAHPKQQAMFAAAKRPAAEGDKPALAETYNRAMGCLVPLMQAEAPLPPR